MMKKFISFCLIIVIFTLVLILPINTSAKTIKEFETEINKYTAELNEKKANLAQNESEVQQIIRKIKNIESQIIAAENEIKELQIEIEESELEIEKKSEESKSIISYYQIANGENSYLEYAFGANDITDMIYRLSIVEQLTEYNDKVMRELEELIRKNQERQKELAKRQDELKIMKSSLQKEQAKIEADSASIRDSLPSIQDRINEAQKSLKYYKSLGCGSTEDIQACEYRIAQAKAGSVPSVGFFSRPMQNGYIVRGMSGGHLGYDLSSDNKAIAVYPIAAGVVHAIYTDACTSGYWCRQMGFSCNGNAKIVVIKHNYNGKYIYSSYVHLRSYGSISVNQIVTKDTIIGYMGSSGCSSGPHLHLEIANCHWKSGGCSYDGYTARLINPSSLISFPGRWTNR